jgi:hypothetical protein
MHLPPLAAVDALPSAVLSDHCIGKGAGCRSLVRRGRPVFVFTMSSADEPKNVVQRLGRCRHGFDSDVVVHGPHSRGSPR